MINAEIRLIIVFVAKSGEALSVQFSHSVVSNSLRPHELQHTRPPGPSPTAGVYPNPCPLSWWCYPTISSSVILFSSCPQSFPASGSFQMNQLSTSGGQSIGVSAWTSVHPMNTQDWSPLGWTGWISLQSNGPSKVFSNTKVQNSSVLSFVYRPTLTSIHDYPRSSIKLAKKKKKRLGTDCASAHELLIAKFRLKLKKVGKTTRPFRCDLNQIP